MQALNRLIVRLLPFVPRPIVGRVSARYIAGNDLESAVATVQELNARGISATADILGEFVTRLVDAEQAVADYMEMLDRFRKEGLDSQASVKLTQLGLKLDFDSCLANMRRLAEKAKSLHNLITIDMEDSSCTDDTLRIFSKLRPANPNVGVVLQARLKRSRTDLEELLALEPHVRVCKGIYVEPPEIAHTDSAAIRAQFMDMVTRLLSCPSFVGIATHDPYLLDQCAALLKDSKADPESYEFQMLLGVREDLRRKLLKAGFPVRVYVPYGQEWYAYSIRRLQENPEIAGHVLRNVFRLEG